MGKLFNMVEGFINDMVSESSYLEAPTIAECNNETTTESEIRKLKPVVVDENNNDGMKRAHTGLEPNNILGAHVLEEKEELFCQWAANYNLWNNHSYTSTKGNELEGSHTFTGATGVFNLTKTKHNGKSKIRIVSEVTTSNKLDFYIGKHQT